MRTTTTLIPVVVSLTACSEPVVVGELQEVTSLKAIPNRNLDLLFVIDNSGSMADSQESLAASFPLMMDVLAQLDGGLPNLHIGVVSSDMGTSASATAPGPGVGTVGNGGCAGHGDDGVLQTAPSITGSFISDIAADDGSRVRNYTGALRDVFSDIALVGDTGCGFEQHLSAMRRGLTNPANAGFLRPDANLAVVVIADEDDCSLHDAAALAPGDSGQLGPLQSFRCTRFGVVCDPDDWTTTGFKGDCVPRADSPYIEDVQPFVDALLAIKPDPRMVMVAGIVGDPWPLATELRPINNLTQMALVPSCTFDHPTSGPQLADPAIRLYSFLDAFPGRSQLTSICSSDLSSPLATIGDSAKKLIGDPCLDSQFLADASPEPGMQPTCEVVDIRDSDPDAPSVLPSCGDATTNCYEIVRDPAACPAAVDNLRVQFHRSTAVSDDTWTHVRCRLLGS